MIKRVILVFVLLVFSWSGYAQEVNTFENRNELKFNFGYLLLACELTYERILTEEQSVGASISYSSIESNYILPDFIEFLFTPYYRVYFGKKIASGLFIEANAAFLSERVSGTIFNEDTQDIKSIKERQYAFGLGVSAGYKHITKREKVLEIYLGGGRSLINFNNNIDNVDLYPRIGLILGKRF